ncbi:MAG: retropepsin-like aspartic protease, partial [Candidatus Thermoplasmatota archaeon]|nr:retropepsin-like aspartic protease [Candidatus Thermoplasmatota archaeon]
EVSISRDASAIVMDGLVSGPEGEHIVQFLLDTGASMTMVPRKVLEKTGSLGNVIQSSVPIHTASGSISVDIIRVDRIEVLGQTMKKMDIMAYDIFPDARVEGLLGLNFLKNFKTTIDFPGGKLMMEA